MLHATFCPFVVNSIPLTSSGAVSNRTWISAEKVSLSAFLDCRTLRRRQVKRAPHKRGFNSA